MDMHDIKAVIDEQAVEFKELHKGYKAGIEELKSRLDQIELKAARPGGLGGGVGRVDGTSTTPPAELKALDLAVRALIAGDQQKAYQHFAEIKGMSAGIGPDGGYVVHPVLSSGMTTVMQEISPVYRLARKVPLTTGDAFEEPVDRETQDATWVSELASRSDTATPQLKLFRVPLNEIYTMPKLSQRLIDTASVNVVQWLIGKSGEAFALKEGAAFHIGDGVGKPHGFLGYPTASTGDATRTWGTIQYVATGASGAFPASSTTVNPADVLVDVITAMKAQYRAGAVWLMNRNTVGLVRKLKDSEGRHVWVDSLIQGQPSTLCGFPVEIDEDMPDVGANSLSIAFANLAKAYTIVEQPGIKYLADPFTDKPNVRLYSYRRVGGGCNNTEAVKLLKFGTS